MVFYEAEAVVKEPLWSGKPRDRSIPEEFTAFAAAQSDRFDKEHKGRAFAMVARAKATRVWLLVASTETKEGRRLSEAFVGLLGKPAEIVKLTEITFREFREQASVAVRRGLFEADMDQLEECLGAEKLRDLSVEETVCLPPRSRDMSMLYELQMSTSFCREIDKIRQGWRGEQQLAHPMHFVVEFEGTLHGQAAVRQLVNEMYTCGRLQSRRVCTLMADCQRELPVQAFEQLYETAQGATVELVFGDDVSSWVERSLEKTIREVVYRYCGRVLTIVRFQNTDEDVKRRMLDALGGLTFSRIDETKVGGEAAKRYLKRLARKERIYADKALLDAASREKKYPNEWLAYFSAWHARKLRRIRFPQYDEQPSAKECAPENDALSRMEALVGLADVKRTAMRAIRFFEVQSRFAARGLKGSRPAMHMVFTGNPGTAKTTVARLLGKALFQHGVLKRDVFKEVGRADLVGRYVGHTAPLVRKAFEEARGGVLFIDEAYALVEMRSGSFGDEAINTIVQEMENHREDTMVIFAGYPKPMNEFLDRNPGLRSRIAFHLPFADYSAEELREIAAIIAAESGLTMTQEAAKKLCGIFENARGRDDFGNGRFARKMIEQARMAQAERLVSVSDAQLTDEALMTLEAEDFEDKTEMSTPKRLPILGFCG